jgi:hypothetical protein
VRGSRHAVALRLLGCCLVAVGRVPVGLRGVGARRRLLAAPGAGVPQCPVGLAAQALGEAEDLIEALTPLREALGVERRPPSQVLLGRLAEGTSLGDQP